MRRSRRKPEKERPNRIPTYYAKAFLPVEEATDDSNANSTLNGVIYKNEAQVEATHADGEAYAGKYDVKVENRNADTHKENQ